MVANGTQRLAVSGLTLDTKIRGKALADGLSEALVKKFPNEKRTKK